jgi:hypothetical protein
MEPFRLQEGDSVLAGADRDGSRHGGEPTPLGAIGLRHDAHHFVRSAQKR